MTEQTTWTLAAACFGFVAAIYFCIGSAFLQQKKIIAISKTKYSANLDFAKATVSQSTQYVTGGLLLVVSFLFQVVATLTSSTNLILQYPILSQPVYFVLSLLVLVGGLSAFLQRKLMQYRWPKVEQELTKKQS